MDEFAQIQGADDLFDDDITPVEAHVSQSVEFASPLRTDLRIHPTPKRTRRRFSLRGQTAVMFFLHT